MQLWKLSNTIVLGSFALAAAALLLPATTYSQNKGTLPNAVDAPNGEGMSRTLSTYTNFNTSNPFFRPLGINGRTCATCHPVSQGMTITPDYVARVFDATEGRDPLFAPVDGANAPNADMSTLQARQVNCSMLLTKGLVRVGMPIPANAEFTLQAVDDPYHYANARDISCFRRPLPSTNLRFLSSVMWDGRQLQGNNTLYQALASQIRDAVRGHMQGTTPPSPMQIAEIIDFETHLYTSQVYDNSCGDLAAPVIGAGPNDLARTPFYPGINDAFHLTGSRQAHDPSVFYCYEYWMPRVARQFPLPGKPFFPSAQQQSVARGEQLFNSRRFVIQGVPGLNDVAGQAAIQGTCSSCHSAPNIGSNALPLLLNTGLADGSRRTADMPLYTLRNKQTGATAQTTDPGAALTTGRWADIGKFKVPSLRGLETHSPYMHNGFSGDLFDILDFYDTRFHIGLSDQEKADLHAFLVTL